MEEPMAERWGWVGERFHERVLGVFVEHYEYKGQFARIRAWARTETRARILLGSWHTHSMSEDYDRLRAGRIFVTPKDFRWKKHAVTRFFKGLEGAVITFQRRENVEGTRWRYTARDLPSLFQLTSRDIYHMPAVPPR